MSTAFDWVEFNSEGQIISECLFAAIVSTKKPTNSFKEFLPLKRGQIKKNKGTLLTYLVL